MTSNVALICVDLQNDFMPGGSLAVPNGDKVIPVINTLLPLFDTVIFTKDWHPDNSDTFASNHPWFDVYDKVNEVIILPDHCVQNTPGADLHPGIQFGQIFGNFYIFKKGTDPNDEALSAFDCVELTGFLNERGIDTLYICGLPFDGCVKMSALDAQVQGFVTTVILDACESNNDDITSSLIELHDKNIKTVLSTSLF